MADEKSITDFCEPANIPSSTPEKTSPRFSRLIKKTNGRYTTKEPLKEEELVYCAKHLLSRNFRRGEKLNGVSVVKDYLITKLAPYKKEVFVVLFLDGDKRVIGYEQVSAGTLDRAVVYPRELIKRVLAKNASAVIIAHNHLSHNIVPSRDDISLTIKLMDSLRTIEVDLLDHIIVGGGRALSFVEHKLL